MKILVLSDTHRDMGRAFKLINIIKDEIDCIFHLGDNVEDAESIRRNFNIKVYNVAGNTDYTVSVPEEQLVELAGKKILLTHGHLYNIYSSINSLYYRAKEINVNAVLFGHTHVPLNTVIDDVLIFNPGSLTRPRGNSTYSYGILDIVDDNIKAVNVEYKL